MKLAVVSLYCIAIQYGLIHSEAFTHVGPLGPLKFLNLGGPKQNFENLWSAVDFSLVFGLSSNVF